MKPTMSGFSVQRGYPSLSVGQLQKDRYHVGFQEEGRRIERMYQVCMGLAP